MAATALVLTLSLATAMVLAQEAEILFLDEPTNHLDISHALSTLRLVQRQTREEGKTVLVILHDLNLAAQFADRTILMKAGQITENGPVSEMFQPEIIERNFDIECSIETRADSGRPYVLAS
ncbi:MAG: ABC transporter ATP-binding protein [Pseudomonadota bacterium]